MKFTVEITLNHDLMKNATQIKDALHRVGMQLDSLSIKRRVEMTDTIVDLGGNVVGEWRLTAKDQ